MLGSSDIKLGALGGSIIMHNVAFTFAVFNGRVLKSHPLSVFPFSCLVRTFPVIPPGLLAVTSPNMAYLANVLIRVMRLYLRPPEHCGFKSHEVPTISVVVSENYFPPLTL